MNEKKNETQHQSNAGYKKPELKDLGSLKDLTRNAGGPDLDGGYNS